MHNELVVLRAPTQVWSSRSGELGSSPIHGVYYSDVRVLSSLALTVDSGTPEPITVLPSGADRAVFVSLVRVYDGGNPDPSVRVEQTRTVSGEGMSETIGVHSRHGMPLALELVVRLSPDLSDLDRIKLGMGSGNVPPSVSVADTEARWGENGVEAVVTAAGADVAIDGDALELRWVLTVPANGRAQVSWSLAASDRSAVVRPDASPIAWSAPAVAGDDRLARWVATSLGDLDGLRLTTTAHPDLGFLAAGSPWFFTLFGRDSLWAARFMLPLGTELAYDTLRVLARFQGTAVDIERAEEPGKILHELRRGVVHLEGDDLYLPPLYFGTVDATPLWITLLHDAWRWGLDDDAVRELLPNLRAALGWLQDHADADGDGLLEYVDRSGHGLANQGWKDSGDSVQWRDGTLATGPIVLCEVQAYAYEAAHAGAALLEHFGEDGASWRDWAARLKSEFALRFWVDDEHGPYPAIALDSHKRAVDSLTSNIGHLLGTGILEPHEEALVAARLVSPELNSGYGVRTMATTSAGYWPLSYHGGSVWTHDTAIAIAGLSRAGFAAEAAVLTEGLLAAASAFEFRMPELHAGDAAAFASRPIPYPAACRPQAWSAAASVSVLASALRLTPNAQGGALAASGAAQSGLTVSGLRFMGQDVSVG
ncbi:MAG: glycogen debranching N-terminal domain-containing protein [Rhodoglobus sp.]